MPRLLKEEKEQIKILSHDELQQIVLKVAGSDQSAYDFVMVNYLDKTSGEQALYERTKADLDGLFLKTIKDFRRS